MPSAAEIQPLTALERIGPKGYLRYVFPFELPADYDLDAVAATLQAGYDAAAQRIATLACEAVPDPDAPQAGVLKLQRIAADTAVAAETATVAVRDLRAPGAFPAGSYAALRARHFPVAAFEADVVMRRPVWVQPGEQRLPVSLVQANFIPGGLVLTWCLLHMFGDSNTFFTWMRVWAEECCRHQGLLALADPVLLSPAMVDDRARVARSSGRHPGRREDHPEYTYLPFTPAGAPPKMLADNHRGQVFYLSAASLARLKAAASPAAAASVDGPSYISTNDALSALLWHTVMAVQWPLEMLDRQPDERPVSVFNIAIDARRRTHPPVHPHTLGCFLAYVSVSAPVRDIVAGPASSSSSFSSSSSSSSGLGLADLALLIRKAVLRAGPDFADDVVTLVEGLDDVDRLVATAFLDVPGYNCVQSSWSNFEVYGLEWGPLLGHRVQSVRAPHVGVINGLQIVLPRLPDGGVEILVGVEDQCLHRLLHDPLWMEFAEAR